MNHLFNIKSFLKFLGKNKLYTFIEIFGLSVSFTFVILIAVYTYQELSVDRFHTNGDRLFALANEETYGFAYKLGDRIKDMYPEVEAICPMVNYHKKTPVHLMDRKVNADLLFADSAFFNMFSFNLREGDRINPLGARNQAVISNSFAQKAFPDRNPLGEVIEIEGEGSAVKVIVNGIMEDIKNSAIPYGDILLRIENIAELTPWEATDYMGSFGGVPILLLVKEGADIQSKADDLLAYMKEHIWAYKEGVNTHVSFVPLKEIYFSNIKGIDGFLFTQGDWTFVMILLSVGVLILIFAVINYVNLSVAQTGFRAKEMATRRLLGSSRRELFFRLMAESILLSVVSFIIGVLLAVAVLPFVNDLLQTSMDLKEMLTPFILFLTALMVVLIGAVSGFLPAVIISNAKPVEVVKGAFRQKTKMIFSRFFITFQNVITIGLVAASITMIFQINHLIKAPLGYNTTNIINIPVEALRSKEQAQLVAQEIEQLGTVSRVGFGRGMPFNRGNNYTGMVGDNLVQVQTFEGDSSYVNMLGFEILKENQLATGNGYYLTPQAFKEFSLEEDATSFIFSSLSSQPQLIAGMIKEFQLQNILFESRPIILAIKRVDDLDLKHLVVEVTGDSYAAMEQVKATYERLTSLEFPGKLIDRQIEESFSNQQKTARIVTLFAGVAILLSLLGLLAMSTYFIQQRSREIAVRRIFGSDNLQILRKLVYTFLSYVVIAFVLVTPFIWYLLRQWLSGYSYRIALSPWIFIASGFFCLLIAFSTVIWQSYLAANRNPVESIKTE
ncbi:MAG: ABC transporter permease [Tannerellaceae bacterium]|nr:ABC transporter permease [Tannerellaceae bacterium]